MTRLATSDVGERRTACRGWRRCLPVSSAWCGAVLCWAFIHRAGTVETVLSVAVLSITVLGVTILSRAGVFGGVASTTPTRSRVVIPVVARAFPRWCISMEPLAITAMEGLLRLMRPLPILLSSFSIVFLNLNAVIHQHTQRVTLNTAKLQLDVWVKSLAVIVQLSFSEFTT